MDISQRHHFEPTRRLRLVLTCNLEIIAIISLSVLEILLRATNVFPVRSVTFSPDDVWINSTLDAGKHTMKWFAYSGDVSYAVVVALSFTLPPLFMLICELLRWKLVDDDVIRISAICVTCDVHSVTRRLVRFFGTFLAGILATMISVDVTKLMVGRLRPVFLDVCAINTTLLCNYCTNSTLCHVTNVTSICSVSQCTQSDINVVRWARMSFPSFYAAITSYAACFMAVYSESILTKGLRCAVFGPFFSMSVVMGSLLCGLSRYALYYNYWTDVAVGFGFGTVISVYVCVFVLNGFDDFTDVRRQRLYRHLSRAHRENSLNSSKRIAKLPWYWTAWNWNMMEAISRDVNTASGEVNSSSSPNHHTSRDQLVNDEQNMYTYY